MRVTITQCVIIMSLMCAKYLLVNGWLLDLVFDYVFQWIYGGWVYRLFVYIYWSYRMIALMLCYHSAAPSTCKDDISASAICHL